MGGVEYVDWPGTSTRLTPWMLHCLQLLDADLRRNFNVHLVLDSSQGQRGIRTAQEQVNLFLSRYRLQASGGGPFGDVRYWQGRRYVRYSGLGTVKQPGGSNHEIQGSSAAIDVADSGGAGIGTMGSERSNWLRANAHRYGLIPEGFEFSEAWHYKIPNIFTPVPASSGAGTTKPGQKATPQGGKMVIYARREHDGLIVAIPEGGKVYNFKTVAEYNRHRNTIATINGQRAATGVPLVTLPPALEGTKDVRIVTMPSESLNDLIHSQGATS